MDDNNYMIGSGIYDITGPAAEVGMMGYAMVDQRTKGIHFRLRARAFVIAERLNPKSRMVFVSADICFGTQSVRLGVVPKLQEKYGDLYTLDNVAISAIHTHSGPGGYSFYAVYDMTTFGFDNQNYKAIVEGIYQAIVHAHENLSTGGRIYMNSDRLFFSNINRSPTSYLLNPPEERKLYEIDGDTDKTMVVLRLENENGKEVGAIAWFAVHCTSMNNTNMFISGDNKGYASYMFEKYKNGNDSFPGVGPFIAIFGQSNEGDVSPNTAGPTCPDGITPCAADSTCEGTTQKCTGKGPGKTDYDSTKIIGRQQFEKALKLYNDKANSIVLSGPIDFRHTHLNMSDITVGPKYTSTGQVGKTCKGALGYSFAAGTTDGPGDFSFKQGDNSTKGNPFWNFVSSFIAKPTPEQILCQSPKPILLDVGLAQFPYPWAVEINPIQIMTIGQLVIIPVPGEFTTMSGRRLRNTVCNTLTTLNPKRFPPQTTRCVIAGLSNSYTQYIATYEEFQAQRYEAASTLYGPHTLAAYQQEYDKLATALATGQPISPGLKPLDLYDKQWSFNIGVIIDSTPFGKKFGDLYQDVDTEKVYKNGDVISAEFYGGHPKNNLMTQKTFLTIEKLNEKNQWISILVDGDWDTRWHWRRQWLSESIFTIIWSIGETFKVEPGIYRIHHFGYYKDLEQSVFPYDGTSSPFKVVA
ncbi:predicted protein [Naegleria gruberi]|uniref:Neutral ceramidase n=1 Tax=Naegleria gruberi TaxID=5762 RepID=D2VAN2_NAEGR|nr:uncharacterized protein NAEGRDRAFT_83074 [Naegleria gruberi]EFC45983.1 predicted protein [Naegleria gruberi]|eukprot:XP_002678727.1 predicted protein [Naegleria gruberi strain NEG-M]